IHKLTVTLNGLTHTNPDDLDIVLQGPNNNVLLMSDSGGTPDAAGVTLTFDDNAANFLPDDGPLVSGTFRPTENIPGGDVLPAPAPAGPYSFSLSDYNGTNPNGSWRLFVYDDAAVSVGSLSGWCLNIWPAFQPGEVHNVRWRAGTKNTMEWDPTPNADFYRIYRGVPSALPELLVNGVNDACRHQQAGGFSRVGDPVPPGGAGSLDLAVGPSA